MHRETLREMSRMPLASERLQAFLLYVGWVFNYGFSWGPVLRFALFSVFSFDVAADTYKTDGCQVRLIRPNHETSHFWLFWRVLRMSSIGTASFFCCIWSVAENETRSKLNEPSRAASERLNGIDWTFISLQRSVNRGLDIILVVSVKLNLTLLLS